MKGLHLPRRGGRKVSKMMQSLRQTKDTDEGNSGGAEVKEGEYRWGKRVVMEVIARMRRASRLDQENEEAQKLILGTQLNFEDEVLSPLNGTGGGEGGFDNGSRSRMGSDGSIMDNIMQIEGSKDSEIRRWERRAIRHLQASPYSLSF